MDWELILGLVFFAFCAGTIDAAVGGGGLIQIPALMGALPQTAPATLFGTNKLASICGTGSAAFSFIQRVKLQWSLLAVIAVFAFISAFVGAACVSMVPTHILRPIVLVMLVVIAIHTFMKKQFGQVHVDQRITPKLLIFAVIGSLAIGFYDGIFGPGTGSFFIFFFIRFLQVDFLHASALSKIGNFMTNLAALSFFIPTGHVMFQLGLLMAIANIAGSLLGVRLALKYGSGFIRILFLILVSILICRLAYQILIAA
ncbi:MULTISPECIES: TSUP family transporter [unclassified Acinetobacter]|uniref:sulfite exporter TauE/SafE family protein n=1 Tax=unclassified Acinetobacter TaxID=196816 RepID=UPI00244A18C9|nr:MULTISPECIES: TSUP family transporter [unclassified Acinetobacter]MDH0029815.1 TSUP family transporter [Acinetobacter sp. GD04021]MDH0885421.1 TSUP family transporter [Acinetobacter sp. GD03873]MDH1081539.1 TSUP family transporter [Acinetobacter sp. GD03983]MDH2188680.1 TSUP family transporter [Acinetobacter sp. GD03645]MDH2204034.1 TSUP family transporter [Acinetobacter sp. GD03647]